MAAEIRAAISAELGLTASAGVAPNKFLAKLASEQRKPDGLFVIRPQEVDEFVRQLRLASCPASAARRQSGWSPSAFIRAKMPASSATRS
jgi:nucleotidyltransferase/DNA polymerase involved in DNA repair